MVYTIGLNIVHRRVSPTMYIRGPQKCIQSVALGLRSGKPKPESIGVSETNARNRRSLAKSYRHRQTHHEPRHGGRSTPGHTAEVSRSAKHILSYSLLNLVN